MKLKKLTSGMCCITLLMSLAPATFAQNITTDVNMENNVVSIESNYISFDEYLKKYGEQNVVAGFDKAETEITGQSNSNIATASLDDEGKSLFECLQEGEFLGMEVQGVSDLSPDNHNFTIKLKDKGYTPTANIDVLGEPIPTSTNAQTIKPYTNYSVYYSDNQPGTTDLNNAYEPLSGSYIYKYSYAFEGNYLCSTDITFNNTKLGCGTQNNNMYVYVAAKSSQQTLDFGLMANPAASNRNQGLYACYNPGDGSFYVEAYPKVKATSYSTSNKTMTLENKTVTIRLSIGTGTAEMYMESGGECIFYKVIDMSTLISGTSAALTFIQAMSCVEANNANTSLTSGSYFKNVKFSNNKLYSFTNGTRNFPTFGSATYYLFACKPSAIDFSYGTNTETISIEYN